MKKYVCMSLLLLLCAAPARAADTTRYFNEDGDPKMSTQSGLLRDSLRLVLSAPALKGDKLLLVMKDFVDSDASWDTPDGYILQKVPLKNCKAELLHKEGSTSRKAVLLLHGGAYLLQLNNIYRDMAVTYSEMTADADVFCLDYRLAPEHVFPAALEDALDAWQWLLARGYKAQDILVAGDSAGGNLTLALALKLRDQGKDLPGALVCMSPWTDMIGSGKSHTANVDKDPIFGGNPEYAPPANGVLPAVRPLILAYVGKTDPRNPYLSPVFGSYEKFPPMLIQVGTAEILESDSEIVYQRAMAAHVDATLTRYYGMFHVFQILGDALPESANAWEEVRLFIAKKFLARG